MQFHMLCPFLCACSYDASGVALLRPLAPGEPTWPELLEVVARRKQMESAAAEAARQVSHAAMHRKLRQAKACVCAALLAATYHAVVW
jgi:hypothetical protein